MWVLQLWNIQGEREKRWTTVKTGLIEERGLFKVMLLIT